MSANRHYFLELKARKTTTCANSECLLLKDEMFHHGVSLPFPHNPYPAIGTCSSVVSYVVLTRRLWNGLWQTAARGYYVNRMGINAILTFSRIVQFIPGSFIITITASFDWICQQLVTESPKYIGNVYIPNKLRYSSEKLLLQYMDSGHGRWICIEFFSFLFVGSFWLDLSREIDETFW